MHFLMGLNDVYDSIHDQIPLIDPTPSMSKAYSMVLKVEKEVSVFGLPEQSAHFVKTGGILVSKLVIGMDATLVTIRRETTFVTTVKRITTLERPVSSYIENLLV